MSSDWGLVILETKSFMTRIWNLFKAAHLVILLSASGAHAKQPNVLFLAVDDMNDWIGSLGATPRAITPNLDKLAARGVNFSNAHTPGVYCAPARAAIFSGQFASTHFFFRVAYESCAPDDPN